MRKKHGMSSYILCDGKRKRNRFYSIWAMMKQRCLVPNHTRYKRYGLRGITVCDEWLDFQGFYNDMYKEYLSHKKKHGSSNTSIYRIRKNGNYCKNNCKWATYKKQANKFKKHKKNITYKNVKYSVKEFEKIFCVSFREKTIPKNHIEVREILFFDMQKLKKQAKKIIKKDRDILKNIIVEEYYNHGRNITILALRAEGFTFQEIADVYQVSRQRIKQLTY